jgi:type IV pilus assembly protein PilQ
MSAEKARRFLPLIALGLTGLLLGGPARSGGGTAAMLQAGAAGAITVPGDPTGTKPMSLDVKGADVRDVIRSIAEFSGVNIVPDREIEGPVSLKLVQVPWREALDILCQSAGLIALPAEGDSFIRVATLRTWRDEGLEHETNERKKEEIEPLETRILTIRYASARELRDAVAFALSKRGSMEVDERTNSILVSDIIPRLTEIESLVDSLDTETLQVEITARLVDVDQVAARALGIEWQINNLHRDGASGSISVHEPLLNPSGQATLGLVKNWGTLDATITAMERDNKAHIISNPKITTVNNRKAKILVGKEVPLIVLDEAGNAVTELKKVGITLEVTPYINSENRITMDLHPEVSDLSSEATVQGGLIFTTTSADTRVMVDNGETAVIGGLIRTVEIHFNQGIPLLRSIPLLGNFFKQSDTRHESRELLIFVSPRVVSVAQK